MKPIFTIHAGEYLAGNTLEKQLKNCEIWIPSKDTGTDLLIVNKRDRSKNISVQVKFSKDFLPEMKANFHENLLACGWWTLNKQKLEKSNADLWILAPYSFQQKKISLIIIEPKILFQRLRSIHGDVETKTINTYQWITKDGKCFETRGLRKKSQQKIINKSYSEMDNNRDFSQYLNNWNVFSSINV